MFTGALRYLFSFVLIVVLSACQPAVAAIDTPSPSPQPPQATLTQTQEPATPIPTADFLPEDIIGVWTRSDPERGDLFIIINSDGSYVAAHGSPDGVMHSGSYTVDGRIFTFVDGWDCSSEADIPGQYVIRLLAEKKYLLFAPYNDACPDRPSAFKSYRWDRMEPTPTP